MGGEETFFLENLPIIHLRKVFACGVAIRNDSIAIISILYKSINPRSERIVFIASVSIKSPSLNIALICAFTLPENAPSRLAISQADIHTGVVGICISPFSLMVMISLFIVFQYSLFFRLSISLSISSEIFFSEIFA